MQYIYALSRSHRGTTTALSYNMVLEEYTNYNIIGQRDLSGDWRAFRRKGSHRFDEVGLSSDHSVHSMLEIGGPLGVGGHRFNEWGLSLNRCITVSGDNPMILSVYYTTRLYRGRSRRCCFRKRILHNLTNATTDSRCNSLLSYSKFLSKIFHCHPTR